MTSFKIDVHSIRLEPVQLPRNMNEQIKFSLGPTVLSATTSALYKAEISIENVRLLRTQVTRSPLSNPGVTEDKHRARSTEARTLSCQ